MKLGNANKFKVALYTLQSVPTSVRWTCLRLVAALAALCEIDVEGLVF